MQRVIQEQQTESLSSYQNVWTPSGLISPQDNNIQQQQQFDQVKN